MMKSKLQSSLEDFKEMFSNLYPYTTHQEKIAVIRQMDGEKNPKKIAKILGVESKNRFEAIAKIFKLREISVSDLIDYNTTCVECEYLDASALSIPDMFFRGEVDTSIPIGLFETLEEVYDEEIINNLSIKEYNELEQKVFKNNLMLFDPALPTRCRKCGHIDKTIFDPSSIISKSTITNIYEQYMDISYYTSMTKIDVDSMFPFEREVFLGLIQKKEDEKTKAQNQANQN